MFYNHNVLGFPVTLSRSSLQLDAFPEIYDSFIFLTFSNKLHLVVVVVVWWWWW